MTSSSQVPHLKVPNVWLYPRDSLDTCSSCLTQQSGDSADAARIEYDIEDMLEAGKQILALQVTSRREKGALKLWIFKRNWFWGIFKMKTFLSLQSNATCQLGTHRIWTYVLCDMEEMTENFLKTLYYLTISLRWSLRDSLAVPDLKLIHYHSSSLWQPRPIRGQYPGHVIILCQ